MHKSFIIAYAYSFQKTTINTCNELFSIEKL